MKEVQDPTFHYIFVKFVKFTNVKLVRKKVNYVKYFLYKNALTLILLTESDCSMVHATFLEPTLSMITSMFKNHLCINSKNGCEEELHTKKLEDHEKFCPFQNVECPVITCTESIVFKDAQKHVDETHKCVKVDDEWEFKGTQKEMVKNVCCLSSYDQQFFIQFQMYEKKCEGTFRYGDSLGMCKKSVKENLIFLRIAMLGHQDEVHSFQATLTYFHENGKKFTSEVDVLPIISGKQKIDSYNAISMEKLTRYYDVKGGEFKTQPIRFTLKITNEKLDEIAKDKNAHAESGLEDLS